MVGDAMYCMGYGSYLVSSSDIDSPIQENSDDASMAPGGRPMQCGASTLQQGHTDRQMQVSETGTSRQTDMYVWYVWSHIDTSFESGMITIFRIFNRTYATYERGQDGIYSNVCMKVFM